MKPEHVVREHDRIKRTRLNQTPRELRLPVGGAEDGPQPAGCLHLLEELHHPVFAPDVLLARLPVFDTRDAEQLQPIGLQHSAGGFEEPLKMSNLAGRISGGVVSIRCDDDFPTRSQDCLGHKAIGTFVVRCRMDDADTAIKARKERINRLRPRYTTQLRGAEPDTGDLNAGGSEGTKLHNKSPLAVTQGMIPP
nr:hypothetical protein [Humisphaera borealis]